ncbi:MAG: endonuclease/exonuclease/phosphatase family protein [Bacteroidota bacterium]
MKNISRLVLVLILVLPILSHSQNRETAFKVVTYNIWNGFDWGKDDVRRAKLQHWMMEQEPDVVGLQELCKYSDKKLAEDAKNWGHNYSVLLKKSGYSVGLTSKYPIEVKEKIFEGMHHGALHCKTGGIDVFVVHFSPGSYKKRREEATIILDKLKKVAENNTKYLVMGDFNAHSPFDADLYKNEILLNRYRKSNADKPETGNLVDNEFDYSVLSNFLAFPLLDVCQKLTDGMAERASFPARALNGLYFQSVDEIINNSERIDYILVSPELDKNCFNVKIYNGESNWYLSDHYPVGAEFRIEK